LAEVGDRESVWYYLEDFNYWYNVTVQTLGSSLVMFVKSDSDSFGESLEGLVSHYHIHTRRPCDESPRDIVKCLEGSSLSAKLKLSLFEHEKKLTALLSGIPFLLDMDTFVDLVTSNSKFKQDFRVISHWGK